jgi:hypothetical protein
MRTFLDPQPDAASSALLRSRAERRQRRSILPATASSNDATAAEGQELWPTLFRFWLDRNQRWRVEPDGPRAPTGIFADLPEAVAFAKRACGGAPATVELRVDGFYVVIHQERGWPNPICGKRAA